MDLVLLCKYFFSLEWIWFWLLWKFQAMSTYFEFDIFLLNKSVCNGNVHHLSVKSCQTPGGVSPGWRSHGASPGGYQTWTHTETHTQHAGR